MTCIVPSPLSPGTTCISWMAPMAVYAAAASHLKQQMQSAMLQARPV